MQLSDRYRDALVFAFDLHRAQERKGSGVPYVAHILGVSSLVLEYGGDEESAIAGLLHDAVEDQGGLSVLARIEERFGAKVAAIVLACTDSHEVPKPPWHERKRAYVAHLHVAPPDAQLVSACDKLYNLRAICADYRTVGEALWGRFTGGREGVLWYYRELAAAFTIDNPVVRDLRSTAAELEGIALTDHRIPNPAAPR
jgi:(p)ppGpp synthase/HD superfamily hydrolase